MKLEDVCIISEGLTDREKEIRKNIFLAVVPSLRDMFLGISPNEFQTYGYNLGYQACVMTAKYLTDTLCNEGYRITVNDGMFKYTAPNGRVSKAYGHPYIILDNEDHRILIDTGRTAYKGLFVHLKEKEYKNIEGYDGVMLLASKELDWKKMLNMKEDEYFTHMKPTYLYRKISQRVEELSQKTEQELCDLFEEQFDKYTYLTKRKDEIAQML